MISVREAVSDLEVFVIAMRDAGIDDKYKFRDWKKTDETKQLMADLFRYDQKEGMPHINSLVNANFHEEYPLVILNYTPVAHNTLYVYPDGWTTALRQCRGIVFDLETGDLVAKPFPKFFNYGEHPETEKCAKWKYFETTEKIDGHLGIIFEYKGNILITTRGSFVSRTAKIATQMLADISRKNNWKDKFPDELTVLVEIIHPSTKVFLDYFGEESFVLIGAYNRDNLEDMDFANLRGLAGSLGLKTAKYSIEKSIDDILKLMEDGRIKNREGLVVHLRGGTRVKFKFSAYLGQMFGAKLGHSYIMKRAVSGSLEEIIGMMSFENQILAQRMATQILACIAEPGTDKEKWWRLYDLYTDDMPITETTFRNNCRQFVKSLSN